MTGDIIDHLAALAHPLPRSPEEIDPPEAFDDAVDQIRQCRQDYADNLRAAWDGTDLDPLLLEIEQVRAAREDADRRLRQLVAYGREFTGPRPYPLAALAQAAGLGSHSSASTFYGQKEIDAVATATGAKRRTRKSVSGSEATHGRS